MPLSTWHQQICLCLPLITSALNVIYALLTNYINLQFLLVSIIPTFLLSSLMCSTGRVEPSIEESERFTRRNDLYRAGVLFTYGRLYGTPFKLGFYISDLVFSYVADNFVGRQTGSRSRQRSEFLRVLPWVIGSSLAGLIFPFTASAIGLVLGTIDRTLWRTAYIALVDDVIDILTWPDMGTWKGKFCILLSQAITIIIVTRFAIACIYGTFMGGSRSPINPRQQSFNSPSASSSAL